MKCPEPSIKEPCYFCYNGECYATHWYECSKGFRKPHEGKKGNKNNRYCKKKRVMTQKKDKEKFGREFAPECDFEVYELNDNMGWGASIAIGDCYYETDPYKDKQDAIAEQRGCLLAIKEQIEKYLATLD